MKPTQQAFISRDSYYSDGFAQPQAPPQAPPQPMYPSSYPYNNTIQPYPTPYNPHQITPVPPATTNPLAGFNLNQIKAMVDRMGGIEGVMGHITRAQKIIQSIKDLSPMLKVLMGSSAAKASTAETTSDNEDGDGLLPVQSHKRRHPRTTTGTKKTTKRKVRVKVR